MARSIWKLTQARVDKAKPRTKTKFPPNYEFFRAAKIFGTDRYADPEYVRTHPMIVAPVRTMLCDGNGLYLCVSISPTDGKTIRKSWLYRFNSGTTITRTGKERPRQRWMGLGSADISKGGLSLAEARTKVLTLRKSKLIDNTDPLDIKHGARNEAAIARARSMTFGDCAAGYVADHCSEWRSAKYSRQWMNSLQQHCADLMPLPIQSVDEAMVIKTLRRMWIEGKIVTGQNVRGRIEKIMDWARVQKLRPEGEPNIARWRGYLEHILARAPTEKKHHAAIPYKEMPGVFAAIREHRSMVSLALQWAILTTARTGSVLKATRSEIKDDIWIIPAAHTKRNKEVMVPLNQDMRNILERLPKEGRLFLIPKEAMRNLLLKIRPGATVHGSSRSTFADFAANAGFSSDEIDETLAHSIGKGTSRAYRRGSDSWLARRRLLGQRWADFLDGKVVAENVVHMRGTR
jgi:integrase